MAKQPCSALISSKISLASLSVCAAVGAVPAGVTGLREYAFFDSTSMALRMWRCLLYVSSSVITRERWRRETRRPERWWPERRRPERWWPQRWQSECRVAAARAVVAGAVALFSVTLGGWVVGSERHAWGVGWVGGVMGIGDTNCPTGAKEQNPGGAIFI
jgi:hypothetical protein